MINATLDRGLIVFFRLAMGWTFLYAASHQIFDPNWSVVAESYYRFTNLPNYLTSTLSLMTSVNRLRGSKPRYQITAEQLVTITQPVLYLWGTRDPFGSVETGRKIASLVLHSEFHTLDDGGHLPWLDAPEYAGRLVTDFLDRGRTVELVNN
jgi:pimeloyl-ACP methyl ester carboxylesterase